jgi:hypothetical protein
MKKLVLSTVLVFVSGFVFANNTNEDVLSVEFSHDCYYRIVDGAGDTLGTVIMEDVPDDVACGDQKSKDRALEIWRDGNN